jgi:integral membrane sensor domain MASE1
LALGEAVPVNATLRLRGPASTLAAIVAVAVAYVVFAALGFDLAYSTKQVTAVWAPAGIALAALILGGYRLWPGVYAGAFAANVLNHTAPPVAAMIAVGNTLGPLA